MYRVSILSRTYYISLLTLERSFLNFNFSMHATKLLHGGHQKGKVNLFPY